MTGSESRVLVVGCGAHMRTSLLPAMERSGLLPAAACDPQADRAQAVARAYGVPAFGSLEEALGSVECDAAVIAVSRELNGTLARECLSRGLPVFVEKPPARTAAEAREIARLAEEKRLLAQTGFMKRFAPSYSRARRISSSPAFGGPLLLCLEASAGPYGSLESFLFDYGAHYLDLALHLCGPVEEVQARRPRVPARPPAGSAAGGRQGLSGPIVGQSAATQASCGPQASNGASAAPTPPGGPGAQAGAAPPGAEAAEGPVAVQVWLAFSSGALGTLSLSTSAGWQEPCERLTLYGTRMRAEVENVVRVRWFRGQPPERPAEGDEAALVYEPNFHLPQLETGTLALQGYLGEMRQFRVSLAMGFPPPSTFGTAAQTLELVEAVLRLAAESGGKPPEGGQAP
ncbi:MAG: Gfo/Idh/MocA family oxidoreductase [Acetobacteraceae bacterium]|nr:Gfo/Idh/MocA family oxidoreductase [Acetobacteraceae bacterium]